MGIRARKPQWYKITRLDGAVQYACKYENEEAYYMWGSGFGIKRFAKTKSIEKAESVPTELVVGFASFDCEDDKFKAVINKNSWWNGWAMPWIHHSDIVRFCEFMSMDEEYMTMKMKSGNLVIHRLEEVGEDYEFETIEPTELLGEKYYYLGGGGFTFEFETK